MRGREGSGRWTGAQCHSFANHNCHVPQRNHWFCLTDMSTARSFFSTISQHVFHCQLPREKPSWKLIRLLNSQYKEKQRGTSKDLNLPKREERACPRCRTPGMTLAAIRVFEQHVTMVNYIPVLGHDSIQRTDLSSNRQVRSGTLTLL